MEVAFQPPPGWSNLRCVPGVYPSFLEPECNCLGDSHIDPEKSLEILEKVCRGRQREIKESKIVPLKDRCGVKSLSNITKDNMCICSEDNDNGVGELLWFTFCAHPRDFGCEQLAML
jgi:hypothetical protein